MSRFALASTALREIGAARPRASVIALALLATPVLADPSATEPATPSPGAMEATASAADAAAAEKARLHALAKRYGYTIVEKDGDTLFCKEQSVTASRVRKQKRCVDEDQMKLEAQNASDVLDKVNRGFTPNSPP